MYTKEDIEDQKYMAREDKADRIRIDIIEWWSNEHGCGQKVDLLNNLLRGLGMKVVLVPYLVRVFYLDLLVMEIMVDAMAEGHAIACANRMFISETPVRIAFEYTGSGTPINGRGSAIEIPADQCISDDAWTFEASPKYEGIGA